MGKEFENICQLLTNSFEDYKLALEMLKGQPLLEKKVHAHFKRVWDIFEEDLWEFFYDPIKKDSLGALWIVIGRIEDRDYDQEQFCQLCYEPIAHAFFTQRAFEKTVKADFSKQGATTIPTFLSKFSRLETILLQENNLKVLPDFIGQFSQLKELNLSQNQITYLPDTLCSLFSLEKMDVSENELHLLPKKIASLTKLKELHLQGNPMESKEIKRIQALLPKTKIRF